MEKGQTPLQASLDGSFEIWFTIVSMTTSLIAVFIPILLMGGIVGRLFTEFAVTMSTAIVISGFVAISLTPMLCSRFLKHSVHSTTRSGLAGISERFFDKILALYDRSLQIALKYKLAVVGIFFAMLFISAGLLLIVPKGFMPTTDAGMVMGNSEARQDISFDSMVKHQQKVARIISQDPNQEHFMSSVGAGGPNTAVNQGRFNVVLKPFGQRKNIDEIVEELRKKMSAIPGIKTYFRSSPAISIGGQNTKALYQLTLSGPDKKTLYNSSEALLKKMQDIPELQDVNSDLQIKNLQLKVDVDRDKLIRFGLSMQQVQDALNSAYSTRQVSVIYTPTNQYWVILEVLPQYYKDVSMMSWLNVRTSGGTLVPLGSVAKITRTAGPQQINHLGQFPSVTLSFNLKPGASLSAAVEKVKAIAKETVPLTISYSFQGTAQAFESSMKNLGVLLIISVLVIYIVLGCLYESFIHPITILSGLPSAGLGALVILLIWRLPLDIYGFLGLILLIGIVKKNAIMMIDYAVHVERTDNLSPEEAIYRASLTRFRPIMMTTMAALLGSLPIALSMGQGSETRQPLGLTIVGGLLISQLVTLYITPVFYIYLDRLQSWLSRHKEATQSPNSPRSA